jgi:hypothetical protein
VSLWDEAEAQFYGSVLPQFVTKGNMRNMARKDVHTIRGTLHWAKVLGSPVDNYATRKTTGGISSSSVSVKSA